MTERFELLEQIGKGGMGTVWKARDTETGESVALKLLHDMYVDDADYVLRFEREVDIARKIDSPHVVKVLGYGKRGGVPYVAMEYVDGPSLKEVIREKGPSGWEDWGQGRSMALQMARALAAAHAAGVIHRDVKPSNVLIDPQGNVKLADFGIARAADLTRMTGGYTMMGTPAYMSPEGDSSEQSDLYGLGCVLYEQLTGSPPFTGDTQQQVLIKHIRELPDLTRLPEASRPVVGWLLEKNPKDRPPGAAALVGVLDGSTRGSIPRPISAGASGWGRRRTKVAVLGGVPLLALVGAIVVTWALGGGSGQRATPGAADDEPTRVVESLATATGHDGTTSSILPSTASAEATKLVTTAPAATEEPTASSIATTTVPPSVAPATPAPSPTPHEPGTGSVIVWVRWNRQPVAGACIYLGGAQGSVRAPSRYTDAAGSVHFTSVPSGDWVVPLPGNIQADGTWNLLPDECFLIEDSPADLAGIPSVQVVDGGVATVTLPAAKKHPLASFEVVDGVVRATWSPISGVQRYEAAVLLGGTNSLTSWQSVTGSFESRQLGSGSYTFVLVGYAGSEVIARAQRGALIP